MTSQMSRAMLSWSMAVTKLHLASAAAAFTGNAAKEKAERFVGWPAAGKPRICCGVHSVCTLLGRPSLQVSFSYLSSADKLSCPPQRCLQPKTWVESTTNPATTQTSRRRIMPDVTDGKHSNCQCGLVARRRREIDSPRQQQQFISRAVKVREVTHGVAKQWVDSRRQTTAAAACCRRPIDNYNNR